eukprot:TRINITY_DN7594_c0_g1_i1.p1 TRINITY_DN7594_c0_g1~~TRINITY_DN7594_c0_g1_i1.p1  ORF type:complete len:166 (+),score=29.42 TRINITY_DN7594_c0_g1_i1:50-499(+)
MHTTLQEKLTETTTKNQNEMTPERNTNGPTKAMPILFEPKFSGDFGMIFDIPSPALQKRDMSLSLSSSLSLSRSLQEFEFENMTMFPMSPEPLDNKKQGEERAIVTGPTQWYSKEAKKLLDLSIPLQKDSLFGGSSVDEGSLLDRSVKD